MTLTRATATRPVRGDQVPERIIASATTMLITIAAEPATTSLA